MSTCHHRLAITYPFRFVLILILAGTLGASLAARADATSDAHIIDNTVPKLSFSQTQSRTATDIAKKLATYHYNEISIDNEFSSQFFDAYIKRLDPARLFFLKSDIDDFEVYRFTLDDSIKKGDLSSGLTIFNRYQKRVIDRLNKTLRNLTDDLAKINFTLDESVELNRENAEHPKDDKEADNLWRRRIKGNALSLKLAGKDLADIEKVLRKRYLNQLSRVKQTNNEDAFEIFINSYTQLYDPHTTYLSPRTSENFNINMKLSLEGIGAVLQQEDEYTKVVRLIAAGPADKQGELKPADRITGVGQGIDGEIVDVVGWRLDEVVDQIRGKKGSTVRLAVIPAGSDSTEEHKIITIVRNRVKLEEQSAKKKVIEFTRHDQLLKIGVISLPTFYIDFDAVRKGDPNYKSTTRDVKKLITELQKDNVDGILIDLRDNGGGSLEEAAKLTGLFIKSGPAVQIRNVNGRIEHYPNTQGNIFYSGPLAVLINRMSASASEIFAGAIQDYQRGIVIGSQSFGKGTVQLLTRLRQGQLKLTQSKFYRVSGESTQHRGVIPDIEFPPIYDKEIVGESSLDNALEWDQILPARHHAYYQMDSIIPKLINQHNERIKTDPDFIYLQDQLEVVNTNRNKKFLSLSEAKRIKEKDDTDKQALALLNKRRLAKGLTPFKTLKESEDEKKRLSDIGEEEPDPYLLESGQILLDAILLKKAVPEQEVANSKRLS